MTPRLPVLIARHAVLVAFAVVFLTPFAGIVLAAFQDGAGAGGFALPEHWTLDNFAEAWEQGHFADLIRSSLIIAVLVVPATIVLSTLAGFGLAVLRPAGHRRITGAFVAGLTLPTELVVIALYYNLDGVGLTNNYLGIALAEIALFLPFGVFWMHTHFSTVPRELVEAGRIDGAGDLRVLKDLLLPISIPATTTLAVLFFVWAWNQFLIVLVLMQSPGRRTATAGLGYFVGEFSTDVPLLSAASLIVIAPVVVVYLIFQRSFVNGITQGAIKG
ncbi:carbohydrate ABC transporter permease [Jiangella sp. DSM 45060]|uniref:carbohydrate ABC transporter permease n=1 Tax=Jiangella sp. DSM 45060 TaxID=1798224 RepID=UPI00087A409D|nr:carbohydrate ABC transporter permease [Jiangella sp. DSM 45060]SDT57324.1 raffinose/stachyose/melibiose transport system permease protein [Jiangella sp. DSM 45060]